jgi:hypothetical protein
MTGEPLARDQARLRLWCHRNKRPHSLGGGELALVRLPGSTFDRHALDVLGLIADQRGDVAVWMGRLRAQFATEASAALYAKNHGGLADPEDPRIVHYAFPFTHEAPSDPDRPAGYGLPNMLHFGCRCGAVYPETVAGLYRAIRPGEEVSILCGKGGAVERAQAHPATATVARLAKLKAREA